MRKWSTAIIAAVIALALAASEVAALISSGALVLQSGTGQPITFKTNGATTQGQVTSAGSWVLSNGAIATNATDGFVYLPDQPGTPTGVPTTVSGVPITVDKTNNLLYAYLGGAWQKVPTVAVADTTWNGTYKTQLSNKLAITAGHYMQCLENNNPHDFRGYIDANYGAANQPGIDQIWTQVTNSAIPVMVTAATDSTLSGYAVQLSTNTSATGAAQLWSTSNASSNTGTTMHAANAAHWGLCGKFKIQTGSGTYRVTMTRGDGAVFYAAVGSIPGVSATNFAGQAGATNLTSTILLDNAWHTCCYADSGSNSSLSCDQETWVDGTQRLANNAGVSTTLRSRIDGANTSAFTVIQSDWLWCWQTN